MPAPIHRRAFTLVELLVVIGIIALLIGILVPVLSKSVQSARGTQCLSNLRQMAVAAVAYANNYKGHYPIAYYGAMRGTQAYSYAWDLTTIMDSSGEVVDVVPGLLWEGRGPQEVQQCPSYDGQANWMADPYTGYNYNTSYIGHGQHEAIPAPVRIVALSRPAETAIFGDGQYAGGANKFMRAPFPNPGDASFAGRWGGTQGFRHRGKTNVAFCDGSVEARGERFTDNADGASNVAAGTGFLSADNRLYGQR